MSFKVHLPPPDLDEMLNHGISLLKALDMFSCGGKIFDDNGEIPLKYVRQLLRREIHASYFIQSKDIKHVVNQVVSEFLSL